MPDQNNSALNSTPVPTQSTGSSPWDEDVDEPVAAPEPKIGTLAATPVKPVATGTPKSFVIPQNIDNQIAPKTVVPDGFPNAIATVKPATPVAPPTPTPPVQATPTIIPLVVETPTPPVQVAPTIIPLVAETPVPPAPPEAPKSMDIRSAVPMPKVVNLGPTQPLAEEEKVAPAPMPAEEVDRITGGEEFAPPAVRFKGILRSFMIPGIILLIVAIFAGLIFMTESGSISLGLEKVYGATGIEKLWGGLSPKPEEAVVRSFVAMEAQSDYKVSGNITMTIDKSIKSSVTDPLVARNTIYFALMPIKAILAVDATTDSTTISTPDISSTSSTTSASSAAVDQATETPYQATESSTKEVIAAFNGFISGTGNQLDLAVKNAIGSDTISLKNSNSELFVESDTYKFDSAAVSGKWLQYNFPTLLGKSPQKELLSVNTAQGFSIKGARVSSEKVGTVRCFVYRIDDVTVGNNLSSFGIKSDTIQAISGYIYIGVKDKLLRKADLKITMATSYPISQMHVVLNFSEFGLHNTFQSVASSDVVIPGGAAATVSSTDGAVATVLTGDAQRKADLAKIHDALEQYYQNYSAYPESASVLKLNTTGNIIERLLVPGYIAALPKDVKDAEGWFYGYKSVDGKSYSLSARMEDTTDPAAKLSGGVYLYLLYNGSI